MDEKEEMKAFALRLPQRLYDAIEQEANQQRRSVNAQIIIALEGHIEKSERLMSWANETLEIERKQQARKDTSE